MTVLANNGLKECSEEVSVFIWEGVNGHGQDMMKNEDVEMHPAGMVKHTENGCSSQGSVTALLVWRSQGLGWILGEKKAAF